MCGTCTVHRRKAGWCNYKCGGGSARKELSRANFHRCKGTASGDQSSIGMHVHCPRRKRIPVSCASQHCYQRVARKNRNLIVFARANCAAITLQHALFSFQRPRQLEITPKKRSLKAVSVNTNITSSSLSLRKDVSYSRGPSSRTIKVNA